jgi:hypothetical protein
MTAGLAGAAGPRVARGDIAAGLEDGACVGLAWDGRALDAGIPGTLDPRDPGPTVACAAVRGLPESRESADGVTRCAELQACVRAIAMMAIAHFSLVGRSRLFRSVAIRKGSA